MFCVRAHVLERLSACSEQLHVDRNVVSSLCYVTQLAARPMKQFVFDDKEPGAREFVARLIVERAASVLGF